MNTQIVIDATGGTLGRIASFSAKQALLGKTIKIVNCNDVLVSGRKEDIIKKYSTLMKKGGNSLKGPKIPKVPERIMKRTIRGMLSHKKGRGSDALKRVMCYNTTPAEFESAEKTSLKRELTARSLTLKEVCKLI
jgi:large subunit ribosomal protein L13